jgi:exosortase
MITQVVQPSYEGLADEMRAYWRQFPDKAVFFGLLGAWLALFHFFGNASLGYASTNSLLEFMAIAYNSENPISDDGHGNLIPFLVLGILWWKRDELAALQLRMWAPALVVVALGLFFHLTGYVVQQQRLSIVGLFVGIYGLTGLVWGPQWLRATLFPFVLFAFMVPLGSLTEAVTFPLRLMVTWIVEQVFSGLFGIGVIRSGTQLFNALGTYQYEVAAACGGMRSLISIFLISVTYGFLVFRSPWKRAVMVAASLPLAVIGNVVRLSTIVIAGEVGGQEAGNYVHDDGLISLLPYIPAILGVMLIGRWLEKTETPQRGPAPTSSP